MRFGPDVSPDRPFNNFSNRRYLQKAGSKCPVPDLQLPCVLALKAAPTVSEAYSFPIKTLFLAASAGPPVEATSQVVSGRAWSEIYKYLHFIPSKYKMDSKGSC